MPDVNLSNVIPNNGNPQNITISCKSNGVPLITKIYSFEMNFINLYLDLLKMAIISPSGIEANKVIMNIDITIPSPLIIFSSFILLIAIV